MTLLFAATIFISATLLFSVQPMVGKMTLPLLGGAPAVWNTCMVFFQAVLLLGYAYVHGSVRLLGVRRQAMLHMVVLLLPLLVLPIDLVSSGDTPSSDQPIVWLLMRLLVHVGLPFFVVSTSAPLFQMWFANTGHKSSGDPYFLYAASNLGSLLALLSYPFLLEPSFALSEQTAMWAKGYGLLIVLAVVCAVMMLRSSGAERDVEPSVECDEDRTSDLPLPLPSCSRIGRSQGRGSVRLSAKLRLKWVVLAFVPSSLMLGVTSHITTDIAAVPLFWVVPLAIYLLTFVFVFARRSPISVSWLSRYCPFVFLPVALLVFSNVRFTGWLDIPIHLLGFFCAAMICHGALAASRPATRYLTEFFLLMSLGGVLGGVFNAIIAPMVFERIAEYPLMLVLACLLRPGVRDSTATQRRNDWLAPLMLVPVVSLAVLLRTWLDLSASVGVLVVFGLPAMVCFVFKDRPIRFGLGYAVVMVSVGLFARSLDGNVVYRCRNFFGVKSVVEDDDGRLRRLFHGSTNHGLQNIGGPERGEPLAYYHRTGPIGDVLTAFSRREKTHRIGVIGLGTGSLAAYAGADRRMVFYEIDPGVVDIASDAKFFNYLDDCGDACDVRIGDGRLLIAAEGAGAFDLIVLDAFSSDAVPTHLLSKEAVALYVDKLSADGVLAFHVSNRHLNFEPMVANLAHDAGLACLGRHDMDVSDEQAAAGKNQSFWMVMARRAETLAVLEDRFGWVKPTADPGMPVWTDQYCDLLALLGGGGE